jgi:hypothetical protein
MFAAEAIHKMKAKLFFQNRGDHIPDYNTIQI